MNDYQKAGASHARRRLVLAAATIGGCGSRLVLAQRSPGKLARIGYLSPDLKNQTEARDAFLGGLRSLGYAEGRDFVMEYRGAQGDPARFPSLAIELASLKVDVIVTSGGSAAAFAAKHATSSIPIVFAAVGDPVGDGLVESLAHPGANVTGLTIVAQEMVGKSFEMLAALVPGLKRMAFLIKPDAMPDRSRLDRIHAADAAAAALGIRLQVVEARFPEDFERAFKEMVVARADALVVLGTPLFDNARVQLVGLAERFRLPALYSFKYYVDAGGMMSYGPDVLDLYRRAGSYVDRVLKGEHPRDMPVERPLRFKLILNAKTAKDLGLAIPASLRRRADEVVG